LIDLLLRIENQLIKRSAKLFQLTRREDVRWPRNVRQDLGNLRENPARWVNRLEAQSA
jgi:hypothetical protein